MSRGEREIQITSTQYYNDIVRLDSIWVDMELVAVAVYWYTRRRDGNITI